jgi:hypothetical protein
MKQILKDLISENRGGKYSSKKIWGHIIMLLVSSAYIMDGFGFYKANENLFYYMLIAGTTLLGLNLASKLFKKDGFKKTSE